MQQPEARCPGAKLTADGSKGVWGRRPRSARRFLRLFSKNNAI